MNLGGKLGVNLGGKTRNLVTLLVKSSQVAFNV